MRVPRIYQNTSLTLGGEVSLADNAANHVARVLRLRPGDKIIIFNGQGGEYLATILQCEKRQVIISIDEFSDRTAESPLNIHLGQVISRGERMDFAIQKSVELGVNEITPLFSDYCQVKLANERLEHKIQHWQQIAVSAAEQSGRTKVPTIHAACPLNQWMKIPNNALGFVLEPSCDNTLQAFGRDITSLKLIIGPEGGLSDQEIISAKAHDFKCIKLGPRILRTETAALSAITVLQFTFGDLG